MNTLIPPAQQYFTKEQASAFSGLCIRTLDLARQRGQLHTLKVGKRVLIKRDELEAFLERHRVTTLAAQ